MKERKTVLVTGASTGIGEAIVYDLVAQGHFVFAGVRKKDDGERLQSRNPELIQPVELDVTKPEQIQKAVETIASQAGARGLYGLVNNAGVVVAGPLEFITADDLRSQFEVNVIGLHEVTRGFLPLIRKSQGRIVHIGSISGRFAYPFLGPYAASKFAVEGLADSLRRELRSFGVKVVVIEPGRIQTPIWKKSRDSNLERRQSLPVLAETYYGEQLNKIVKVTEMAQKKSTPPSQVAKTVRKVLFSRNPCVRYTVGLDACIEGFLTRYFPAKFVDWFVSLIFNRL